MPAPALIARRRGNTSTAMIEDALVRLDAARARLASRRLPWSLLPTMSENKPGSRTGSIVLGRTERAVLDAFIGGKIGQRHVSLTVAVPLGSFVLRVQHRRNVRTAEIPDIGRRTIDAIRTTFDDAERILRASLDPDAEDRFAVVPAMIRNPTVRAVEMPTSWDGARYACSCGAMHAEGMPPLPEAYDVVVEPNDDFAVHDIRIEGSRIPIVAKDALSRLRDLATLERLRIKDAR